MKRDEVIVTRRMYPLFSLHCILFPARWSLHIS